MEAARKDGRGADQMRQLRVEQGLLVQADGSARVAAGETRVMAAVYGPAESLARDEQVEKAAIEVVMGGDRQTEETLAACVEAVCLSSLHPRTAIRIVVQPLTQDGSLFAAVANAACLALMDAGIQLSSLFVGVTCAVLKSGEVVADPTKEEEEGARALVDLVFDRHEGLLVSHCRQGSFSTEEYFKCFDLGASMCAPMIAFLRKTTESRFVKDNT